MVDYNKNERKVLSMKKIIAIFLTLMLVLSFSMSVSAANPIVTDGGTDSATVKATFNDCPDVYSVDISWGALTYIYTETWHADTKANTYAWASTAAGTADKVTVANSSNVAITASLAYTSDVTITGVTGTFAPASFNLALPSGTATTNSSTLSVSGTPSTQALSSSTVGSVTVTITKQD